MGGQPHHLHSGQWLRECICFKQCHAHTPSPNFYIRRMLGERLQMGKRMDSSLDNVTDGALNRNLSAPAGEHLVLGELLKRGRRAFLAQGPSQPGWDIIVVDEEQGRGLTKIQVKTIDWPRTTAVNVSIKSLCQFDFMVVVLLQRQKCHRSRFLIFARTDVEKILSEFNDERKDGNRTFNIGENWERMHCEIKGKEDQWCQIWKTRGGRCISG